MKKLLVLGLALILASSLVFAQGTKETTASTAAPEVITVWSDNAHEETLRRAQIETFNNGVGKELGIFIEYKIFGGNFSDTIKIAAQAGEAPDLFRSDSKWMQGFVDSGFLVPIEELPGSETLLNKFKPMLSNQAHIFNGKTYTLPYNLTTYGFIINKDLFKQVGLTEKDYPKTWADVRRVAKIITERSGGKAYGLGLSSTLWTISSFYTMPNGQNIGHYGYDWNAKQFDYSAYNPLIEAIDQMVNDGSVFPGFEVLDGDGIRAQFAAGRIGMIGAASFDCAVYTKQFPANFDWAVIDVPAFSANQVTYKRFGNPTNLLCVGVNARKHPEKVLKVLEFFYADENAAAMYEEGLYIPIRSEAIAMAKKEPSLKGWKEFAMFTEVFAMPPVPDTLIQLEGPSYREVIVNMWTNPSLYDVKARMADVDKRYNAALSKLPAEKLNLYTLAPGVTAQRSK
jgi:multiple sugar transport system substrate-binding protein